MGVAKKFFQWGIDEKILNHLKSKFNKNLFTYRLFKFDNKHTNSFLKSGILAFSYFFKKNKKLQKSTICLKYCSNLDLKYFLISDLENYLLHYIIYILEIKEEEINDIIFANMLLRIKYVQRKGKKMS